MNRDEPTHTQGQLPVPVPRSPVTHVPIGVAGLLLTGASLWMVVRQPARFPLMLMPLGLGAFAAGACVRSWCDRRGLRRDR
ncbi:hypothetical protein DN069_22900 [Streptacidiphilus pinicola]|uniref:DUF2530 domain-containing protein n=1 Tax=Streptacidiphilus pinicola TaxID=2219663 RepID=A0A2X0IZL2_9ACTN|nr:hypothetical protein DN069_22900 [Streptacidiphilus pinicola]